MDRGPQLAEEHDQILRNLPQTTGRPLSHWFGELEKIHAGSKGFLAVLEHLRDRLGLPHHEANAVAWSFQNPYVIPEDVLPREGGSLQVSEEPDDEESDDAGDDGREDDEAESTPAVASRAPKAAKPAKAAKAAKPAKAAAKPAKAAAKPTKVASRPQARPAAPPARKPVKVAARMVITRTVVKATSRTMVKKSSSKAKSKTSAPARVTPAKLKAFHAERAKSGASSPRKPAARPAKKAKKR